MTARTATRLAWAAFALAAVMLLGSEAAWIVLLSDRYPADLSGLVMLPFPVVGIVIASRQPRNSISWILLAVGLVWGTAGLSSTYATYAWVERPLPGSGAAMAVAASSWAPGVGLLGTFLLLLFPDGHLPSPRWRPWGWFCALAVVVPFLLFTVAPGPLRESPFERADNPLGVDALRPFVDVMGGSVLLVPVSVLGCAVALVQRFRRSRGQERLQLKWLATAGATCALVFVVAILLSIDFGWSTSDTPFLIRVLQDTAFSSFALIPVAIGIAVLRYRLYEIERIINRALVYGSLTAVLALMYAAGVVGVGGLVRAASGRGSNGLVVAASTLAVAALFRPARDRIQGFIDRRFNRRRYDAARTVEDFSQRLRDEVTLDNVTTSLLHAVHETLQPRHAWLWLRQPSSRT